MTVVVIFAAGFLVGASIVTLLCLAAWLDRFEDGLMSQQTSARREGKEVVESIDWHSYQGLGTSQSSSQNQTEAENETEDRAPHSGPGPHLSIVE